MGFLTDTETDAISSVIVALRVVADGSETETALRALMDRDREEAGTTLDVDTVLELTTAAIWCWHNADKTKEHDPLADLSRQVLRATLGDNWAELISKAAAPSGATEDK